MIDWKPIETAPKDGTEIIVSNGFYITTVSWQKNWNFWGVCVSGASSEDKFWEPTHWAEMPEMPK